MPSRRCYLCLIFVFGCSDTQDGAEHPDAPIDRTGFDITVCEERGLDSFEALRPQPDVDYLAIRDTSGFIYSVGDLCESALDPVTCMSAYNNLSAPGDAWFARTAGGALPPSYYLSYSRGDEVGVVGLTGLGPFVAPIDDPLEVLFVAAAHTTGSASCAEPLLRAVDGGFEIITTRVQTCGGATTEILSRVDVDGTVETIEEAVIYQPPPGPPCP